MHGPGVPPGLTMAINPHGPQEFLTVRRFEGQIVNQGFLRLSADGRTLIEEYWGSQQAGPKRYLGIRVTITKEHEQFYRLAF
jgi:hypothetical protein